MKGGLEGTKRVSTWHVYSTVHHTTYSQTLSCAEQKARSPETKFVCAVDKAILDTQQLLLHDPSPIEDTASSSLSSLVAPARFPPKRPTHVNARGALEFLDAPQATHNSATNHSCASLAAHTCGQ